MQVALVEAQQPARPATWPATDPDRVVDQIEQTGFRRRVHTARNHAGGQSNALSLVMQGHTVQLPDPNRPARSCASLSNSTPATTTQPLRHAPN